MKRRFLLVFGGLILTGLVWRIIRLVAQEAGVIGQEKIRVEVIDTWPVKKEEAVFPMDVTLAKGQKYSFQIFDSEGKEIVFKRLDSNSFADRNTIYLQIASAAKPGKFKIQALSEGTVLREAEFLWGIIGINFTSWPLEIGVSNQIFISGCGDVKAKIEGNEQTTRLVDKCWRLLEYQVEKNQTSSLVVENDWSGLHIEKKVEMVFEKKPVVRIKRSLADERLKIDYSGDSDQKEMTEELGNDMVVGEVGDATVGKENGLTKIHWNLDTEVASNSASYKIGVWDPESIAVVGPIKIWQKNEKKFYEQTTQEKKVFWQEPYYWLIPGYVLDNNVEPPVPKEKNDDNWVLTGRVGFRLSGASPNWIVEYKDISNGSDASSYTYDPETSIEDAPLLFEHYKVVVNNAMLYVYEVNKRVEEEKEKIDYQQIYP